ncbi:unnamed protein product [Meloidogyne enterolobii]|uniref:Uncharacterized protein n=1 Tax=Meloidogyne enterolobii TaxID=390850 RepID=A0ACB0ZHQ6_MELEN
MQAFAEFYNVSIDGVDLVLIFLEPKTSDKRLIMNDKLLSDVEILDRYIKELSLEINFEGLSEGNNNSQRVVRLKDFEVFSIIYMLK